MSKPVQQIKRITLTGAEETVSFSTYSPKYLVKNFSSADVYVSFVTPIDTDESIKIPASMAQLCVGNEANGGASRTGYDTIYISGTGEVEVQQLWF